MKMPFGKHKGVDITDVPTAYLSWLEEQKIEDWLRREVAAELKFRENPSTGKTTKLSRDVVAGKLFDLLKQMPDDMFGSDLVLGEFKVRFDKK